MDGYIIVRQERINAMSKISVLVPVYNVESYLEQCLDSLIRQSWRELEIICVNDGSTDKSGQILERYAMMDSRIVVIHKENTGYGNSMNVALSSATGEYVAIVESDDFACRDMIRVLYEAADLNDADVVKGTFYNYHNGQDMRSTRLDNYPRNKLLNIDSCPTLFNLADTIWSCLYKRSFLLSHHICFHETPGASYQDISFALQVWMEAEKVYFIEDAVLHYRRDNLNSSMNNPKKVFCVFDEYEWIEEKYDDFFRQNPMLETYFMAGKYWDYFNHYHRVGIQYQYALLCRLAASAQKDKEAEKLRKEVFFPQVWDKLSAIDEDINLFFEQTAKDPGDYRLKSCGFQNELVYGDAFFEALQKYPLVLVYGAGQVGRCLAKEIRRRNGSVDSFVVTDVSGQNASCMGIPVYEIQEYLSRADSCAVVIAVTERGQYEIYEHLQSYGFQNIFRVDKAVRKMFSADNTDKGETGDEEG